MSSNIELVERFIGAWNANDVDAIMSHLSDDCFYHNVPMEPVTGSAAIRDFIAGFSGMAAQIDWVVHHIAEGADGSVLTERTDRFLIGEKWMEIPVMGCFEIAHGKITKWRDYFDLAQMQKQLPGS